MKFAEITSPPRHPVIFGPCDRFTIRSGRKVPQPRLEHPAAISRVRRPPQKSISFPAHLDQLDQQLARNSIANFDAHDSHRMAAVIGPGRRGIQRAFPQSASAHGHVMPPSLVMQGLDQLVHES
jgi:hypothetical protein